MGYARNGRPGAAPMGGRGKKPTRQQDGLLRSTDGRLAEGGRDGGAINKRPPERAASCYF
jgi:hypothetical protein